MAKSKQQRQQEAQRRQQQQAEGASGGRAPHQPSVPGVRSTRSAAAAPADEPPAQRSRKNSSALERHKENVLDDSSGEPSWLSVTWTSQTCGRLLSACPIPSPAADEREQPGSSRPELGEQDDEEEDAVPYPRRGLQRADGQRPLGGAGPPPLDDANAPPVAGDEELFNAGDPAEDDLQLPPLTTPSQQLQPPSPPAAAQAAGSAPALPTPQLSEPQPATAPLTAPPTQFEQMMQAIPAAARTPEVVLGVLRLLGQTQVRTSNRLARLKLACLFGVHSSLIFEPASIPLTMHR